MQCNIAILPLKLHQLAILALVLALADFHCQPVIDKTFQLAADAARLSLVAETLIHILRRKWVGQTAIAYPRLLDCRSTVRQ